MNRTCFQTRKRKISRASLGAETSSCMIQKFPSFHYAQLLSTFPFLLKNKTVKEFTEQARKRRERTCSFLERSVNSLGFCSSPASALLLSFFITSMLLLVAISVSVLVLHDVRTVQTTIGGAQAYYAAEGMSELGLETVKSNLPGYEPSFEDYTLASTSVASMLVHAREASVPCEGQSEDGWRRLDLNESVQVPLFAQLDSAGNTEKINKFHVEFYVADEEGNVSFPPEGEVLRWKILGLYYGETEAISEYIPLDTGNSRTTRDHPSIFGTSLDGSVPTSYSYAKFYKKDHPSTFYPAYSIEDFLSRDSYNYLILTNVVRRDDENTIFFKFVSDDAEGVCEYTEMASTGDTDLGDARKELTTLVKEGENLPVFDFVLYHTEDDEAAGVPDFSAPVLSPFSASELGF